ncbi:hypothetical protein JG687_00009881 [Phytophthora cactorum]|uniref:Uncharacterized protein n=1 Tax=Phytophthora cactorum TaxID=29920 RepID=A0A329RSK0_9STRA|nr:hypothetical protein Pcac1_g8795 [Phytophthora cactorum]KAG2851707.1 hypothetical protein PC113_g15675 [Phytophthora cactorum]KAG2918148.1 hypothetical protein PC117_g17162 [Phytophthora cactorum]KAG2976138.1 hypothetical protein PC118_g13570 [Phytophthora cactorum]KAG3214211.1 hypothetical protein PC129_g14871 [Phytophthora cactorum]
MNDPTAALMPTHREENQLKELFEELKTFLNPPRRNSKMPMQPEFEDACVAVLAGKADSLTEQQRSLLPPFAAPATTPPELEDKALGFADRALKKHKLQCETPSEYPEIAAIPPT